MKNKKTLGKRVLAGCMVGAVIFSTLSNTTVIQAKYNRKKATKYAKKYCGKTSKKKRNSNTGYNDFNEKSKKGYPFFPNNDCTNFASQCLYAGGIKMNKLDRDEWKMNEIVCSTDKWMLTKYYRGTVGKENEEKVKYYGWCATSTLTCVDEKNDEFTRAYKFGLQDYMSEVRGNKVTYYKNTKKDIKKLIKKAKVGDIVQIYRPDGDSEDNPYPRFDHSYIVGKKKKNKDKLLDIYLYAHTGNRDATTDDSIWYLHENNKDFKTTEEIALISVK